MKKYIFAIALSILCFTGLKEDTLAAVTDQNTVKITLSATGDCTLGWDSRYQHNFQNYYKKYGNAYFFSRVKSIFEKDDITLVNFEGTLTSRTTRRNKAFTFRAPASYVNILKKGNVEVVNLANNHSEDFGKESYLDTVNTMKTNGIGYCRNTAICYKRVKGVKMAFVGFDVVDGATESQMKKVIKTAKDHEAKIIIVSIHWGIEHQEMANSKQRRLGHLAIDQGASLVIGHHPHVLQGIETYRGKHILYSLGNFCFGGNRNPRDKDTMIYQETFTVTNGKVAASPAGRVIPCLLSSTSGTNDFKPYIVSSGTKSRIIKKLRSRSKGMHTTIYSNGNITKAN